MTIRQMVGPPPRRDAGGDVWALYCERIEQVSDHHLREASRWRWRRVALEVYALVLTGIAAFAVATLLRRGCPTP